MNRRVKAGPISKLFKSAGRWMKGALAATRRSRGRSVDPESRDAACWCLSGAIQKCYPTSGLREMVGGAALKAIQEKNPQYDSIPEWNDAKERTFGDVRELVERLGI